MRAGACAAVLASLAATAGPPGASGSTARQGDLLDGLAGAAPALDPQVLALALRASSCAARRGLVPDPGHLTVIDYSRPSTEPRLWTFDLGRRVLLYEELVAHGRGSGENEAVRFSNRPGSHQTSLGLFVTLDTYLGRHGRSLRLHGLEPGVNDLALERAIVIHGAGYVSRSFAALNGRLGRSFGCPALALEVAQRLIEHIRGGTPLFAYYPDPTWLRRSTFLGRCEDAEAAAASPAPSARRVATPQSLPRPPARRLARPG
jgi:hypothetical protein